MSPLSGDGVTIAAAKMNGLPQFGLNPFLTYPPPSTAFSFFPSGIFSTPYPFLFPLPPIDTSKMLATWEQLKFSTFFDEQPLDLSVDRGRSDGGDNLEDEYIDVIGVEDENGEYPLNLTKTSNVVVRPTAVYVKNLELPGTLLSPPNQQQGTLFKDNLHPTGPFKYVRNNEMVKPEVKSSLEDTPLDQEVRTQKKTCGSKTTENKHYCKICDKGFAKAANLKRHLKIHTTVQTSLKCPSCERDFSSSFRLLRHIKNQHKVNVELPEKN